MTALMYAAAKGKLDCLEHLIAKGANPNVQDNVRRGPAATDRGGGRRLHARGRRCPAGAAAPLRRRTAPPPCC
eukprot:scaffold1478_cov36-Phaeocystis_antarctica.AAC.2